MKEGVIARGDLGDVRLAKKIAAMLREKEGETFGDFGGVHKLFNHGFPRWHG